MSAFFAGTGPADPALRGQRYCDAAWMFSETRIRRGASLKRIVLFATRQEPASLEEPQGRTAGPALQAGIVIEG